MIGCRRRRKDRLGACVEKKPSRKKASPGAMSRIASPGSLLTSLFREKAFASFDLRSGATLALPRRSFLGGGFLGRGLLSWGLLGRSLLGRSLLGRSLLGRSLLGRSLLRGCFPHRFFVLLVLALLLLFQRKHFCGIFSRLAMRPPRKTAYAFFGDEAATGSFWLRSSISSCSALEMRETRSTGCFVRMFPLAPRPLISRLANLKSI